MSATRKSLALFVVGPTPPPLNGMTVMTSHVLAALGDSGWHVIHIDTSDHRPVGNVGRLDLQNVLLAAKHAWSLLGATRRPGPRLLYLPIAQGNLGFLRDSLFFEIARARRIPVVIHLHGAAFSDFYQSTHEPMRWLIRRCLERCRYAVVLSPSLRHVFGELIPEPRIGVVRNGVPRPVPTKARPRHPYGLTALFLSNLSTGKGYGDFLEAADLICRVNSDIHFLVAGEWPTKKDSVRSREWVRRRGIGHQVEFVGTPSGLRKHQLLQRADVFVFPPRQTEGQPVVLLEAMSHGLPVITTSSGGIVDIVRDGLNGILIPPGDPPAIAQAILRLAGDDSLRARMGEEGKRLYEAGHTLEAMTASLDDVFARLVEAAA